MSKDEQDGDEPIFAAPAHKARKTLKVTKGGGPANTVDLSFKDLSVFVKNRKEKKALLRQVSGYVGAGELLMVLGSSGCGKSTLLRTVANVTRTNFEVQGDILFNSRRLKPSDRRQILSFVAQESPLLGEFTVMETLWFAARLYFGYFEVERDEIQLKIDDIIAAVGLESCKDVLVGNLFFRGLSGGQRKRLSIAAELISSPACIVLDEPTSGLDSSAALSLVQALRGLTKLGHTIIASVHQPSSKMWSTFSNVMLMSQGRCVYFGAADRAVQYFSDIGLRCPDHFNPADYFSAVLSTDFAAQDLHVKSPDELADIFDNSATRKLELTVNLETVEKGRLTLANTGKKNRLSAKFTNRGATATAPSEVNARQTKYDALSDNEPKTLFGTSSIKQAGYFVSTITLLHRFMKSLYREPGLILARVAAYVVLGLVLGLMYFQVGLYFDTEMMLARCSVLLGAVGFFSFFSVSAIPFIMDNRVVMDRERQNGAYPVIAYVIADVLSLLPATALLSAVASLFVVFMIKLNNFGIFFLILWLMLFCVECLVHALACMFTKVEATVAVAIGVFGVVFLCAGFFIPVPQMSWGIRWVAYVSPIRYAFSAFMRNEFEQMTTTTSAQFPTGDAMLDFFGLNSEGSLMTVWENMLVIGAFAIAYIIVIYLAIRILRR